MLAFGEAAVDAVALCVVRDDEHPPLGSLRGGQAGNEGRAGQNGAHDKMSVCKPTRALIDAEK
jgi:hypothetical protein